jgi:hypothetical protein
MPDNFLKFEKANSDQMLIPNGSVFPFGQSDFSVCFWIKKSTDTGFSEGIIGDRKTEGGGFFSIEKNSADKIIGFFTRSGPPQSTPGFSLGDNDTWYHIVLTFENLINSYQLYFYKNTLEVDSKSGSFAFNFDDGQGVRIGCLYGGAFFFNGSLDDIRFYNKVLTEDEIIGIYNGGDGVKMDGTEPGLIWGSNCDDGEGTTVTDVKGGSDGSLSTDSIWELNGGKPFTEPDPEPETIFIEDRNNFTDGNSNLNGKRISATLQDGRSDGALTLGSSL